MKKTLYLVVVFVMLCAVFVGCRAAHMHTYSNLWSFDEAEHWHQATCEHSSLDRDRAQHSFVNGKCSTCGYVQGAEPTPYPQDYEFGDDISVNNDAFYKDYSDQDKELYYTLWKDTTKIKVEIEITPYELSKINEAFYDWRDRRDSTKADTYRKCNLTITVNETPYRFEEVGIRMRGNTSRTDFVDQNGNIYNLVHFRFSLSETFDGEEYEGDAWGHECYHDWSNDPDGRKARKERAFATMEKFYYKWNKSYDQTYIREVYTNRMFQAYGILAPHITLSQFCITQNGGMQSLGVGGLYELIDKQFIKRNFDKEHRGGDLYKCTYSAKGPADLTRINDYLCGIETATEGFSYDLKTNDDPEDFNNHEYIQAFVNMLNDKTSSEQFKTKLESMMDVDYFARFEAVNYLVGNPDCIRNHANNYYLYFTPNDGNGNSKAYLIPYDYDRCLGVAIDWNPTRDAMTGSLPYTTETTIDEMDRKNTNPLYTRTILDGGIAEYRAMYTEALKNVLDGDWFTEKSFNTIYNAYNANYANLARPSFDIPNVNMDGFVFTLNGSQNVSNGGNLKVSVYMQLKRQTALNNIDK